MQPLVPILAPPPQPARLRPGGRLLAAGLAAGCLAVLVTALKLTPAPTGIGTHRQLGLEACQFERQTGLACPTCGMTTSFAHFVRGQWFASFYVQPFAAFLALGSGMLVWGGLYVALTGRPIHRLLHLLPARYYLTAFFTLAILAWAFKIVIHLRGIDGGGREG